MWVLLRDLMPYRRPCDHRLPCPTRDHRPGNRTGILRSDPLVQLRNRRQRPKSLVRDDVIPTLMPLEDHAGIGQLPDMEQEISPPEPGQLGDIRKRSRAGRKRPEDLEPGEACYGFEQFLYHRIIRYRIKIPDRPARLTVHSQRLHQADLVLEEPAELVKTGGTLLFLCPLPEYRHLLAIGFDEIFRYRSFSNVPGGVLQEFREDPVTGRPHGATLHHPGREIGFGSTELLVRTCPGILFPDPTQHCIHVLLVGTLDESLQIRTESGDLRLKFTDLR